MCRAPTVGAAVGGSPGRVRRNQLPVGRAAAGAVPFGGRRGNGHRGSASSTCGETLERPPDQLGVSSDDAAGKRRADRILRRARGRSPAPPGRGTASSLPGVRSASGSSATSSNRSRSSSTSRSAFFLPIPATELSAARSRPRTLRTVRSGAQRREQRQRQLGAEAAGTQQTLEDPPLRRPVEPEQRPAVLLHNQLGVEADPAAGRRQPPGDAERHGHLVAHPAVGLDYDGLAVARREHAGDAGDHRAPVTWRKNAACRRTRR